MCRAHGDLHPGNIFVQRNGIDVIIIDFYKTADISAASRDLALLDVTLGFNAGLDVEQRRALYSPPLLPVHQALLRTERAEAIRQVRIHGQGACRNRAEYAVSVACHLLWYARLRSETTSSADASRPNPKDSGLAYALAHQLLIEVLAN